MGTATVCCFFCREVLKPPVQLSGHAVGCPREVSFAAVTPVKVYRHRSGPWFGRIVNPDRSVALTFLPADLEEAVRTAEDFMGRELEWSVAPTGTIEAR